jgi:hypothetical protein
MNRRQIVLATSVAAILTGGSRPLRAETFRVDDTGTTVSEPVTKMRWRQLVPGRGADHTVDAILRVALRLNLAPWKGRSARLFMGLAHSRQTPVTAAWTTQGRLLAGSVRSGSRSLIFEGGIVNDTLEETLTLSLTADGRTLATAQALQFYFEIDV